jgi:hypothetical protein
MKGVTGRRQCEAIALLAVFCASMTACRNDAIAPRGGVPPIDQMTNLGTTIVDVNLKTGEVVTHPLESAATTANGVDARFFGAPNTISHTFQLRGGAPTAGNTFTLDDHIENQFSFPIGTHLIHATGVFPEDTMGVYVYMSILPTVTAGCTPSGTCSVAADSGEDGAFPFTTPTPQPYMFFKTILEATDGVAHKGLDFTDQSAANGGTGINYFRSFSFRAKAGVTNFKFGVSVSAAVVKPNDTRWKVTYIADSFPNRVGISLADLRSDPDWRVHGSAASVTDTSIQLTAAVTCPASAAHCLRIVSSNPSAGVPSDTITYFRSDSLGMTDSAFISADVATSGNLRPNAPSVFIGMQDRHTQMLVGISSNKIGFCDAAGVFLGTPNAPVAFTNTTTNWRVAKFGADSVVVYGGGTKAFSAVYSTLPGAQVVSSPNPFFYFGNRALLATPNPTGVTSLWSDVVYEIGATIP